MPLISEIGRKHWKVRLLTGAIYLLLTAGALSMIYPFLLMIAGSTKSGVDTPENSIVPSFLIDDETLYQKYTEALNNESLYSLKCAYNRQIASFSDITIPAGRDRITDLWEEFINQSDLDSDTFAAAFISTRTSKGTLPLQLRRFRDELSSEYSGSLKDLNKSLGTDFTQWNSFFILPKNNLMRRNSSLSVKFAERIKSLKEAMPKEHRIYFSVDNYYRTVEIPAKYSRSIDEYNQENDNELHSWNEIVLSETVPPEKGSSRNDWEDFVRNSLNLRWISVSASASPLYRDFLRAKYSAISIFNQRHLLQTESFDDIIIPEKAPASGIARSDWTAFLQGWTDPDSGIEYMLPAEAITVKSTDSKFRDFLRRRFSSIEELNSFTGEKFKSWQAVDMPQQEFHYRYFLKNIKSIKKEFMTRNYISVFDYVALHGRAIVNTVIYCLLAILGALTVNPLAAYALHRYQPKFTYKTLLFLMLTMAFPPMVTQIPNFLLLRELGFLNSFWALVLPGLANGYSIFLLKGFFDSLPKELYESAEIDGAGEFRIFWQITMSLSKPILAVIGLQAFTLAYSNFMMALLVCQNQKMWTIMPWLYQLQQEGGQGIIFASLIIAAIPTFAVFAFCQKIIMRGIVVPVEK